MSNINEGADYAFLFPDRDNQTCPSRKYKKTGKQELKNSRTQEFNKTRKQENKDSRVLIDEAGRTRRPANLTMCDDVRAELARMAVEKGVKVWRLVDMALNEYIKRTRE
jgi:hypothetical protein